MTKIELLNLAYLKMLHPVTGDPLTLAQAMNKVKNDLVKAEAKIDRIAVRNNVGTPEQIEHDAVNTYLKNLKKNKKKEFEAMRKKPYDEIKTAAGL